MYIVHYREVVCVRNVGVNISNVIISQSTNQIRPSEIPAEYKLFCINFTRPSSPRFLLNFFYASRGSGHETTLTAACEAPVPENKTFSFYPLLFPHYSHTEKSLKLCRHNRLKPILVLMCVHVHVHCLVSSTVLVLFLQMDRGSGDETSTTAAT